MIRFGVAGLSHFHAKAILDSALGMGTARGKNDIQVVSISEEDDALYGATGAGYGLQRYKDAVTMCERERLDAVALVERPDRRAETAIRLLSMGIDVLIDKPAALDVETLGELAEAAEKGPGRLFPYFTVRYERPVAKTLELITSGAIGKVSSFTSLRPHKLLAGTRPDWFWDMKGGVAVDLAIHDIDIYRAACGFGHDMAFTAFGSQGSFSKTARSDYLGFADSCQFLLRPEEGPSGTFLADWLTPSADPRHGDCVYFIAGTEGRIEVRGTGGIPGEGEALILINGLVNGLIDFPSGSLSNAGRGPTVRIDPPREGAGILDDFFSSRLGVKASPFAPDWKDLVTANAIAIAAAEAAETGEVREYSGQMIPDKGRRCGDVLD